MAAAVASSCTVVRLTVRSWNETPAFGDSSPPSLASVVMRGF